MMFFMAILMVAGTQFGAYMLMPALPDIAQSLDISSSTSQYMITLYFVAFGASQLILGPLSDIWGRRSVFFLGQGVFILGCILSAVAPDASTLLIGRVLQGLGAGAPLILSRTLLSDYYHDHKLKQMFANLSIAISLIAVVGPLIGGVISATFNWHYVFVFLGLFLTLSFVCGFFLLTDDNAKNRDASGASITTTLGHYFEFLQHGQLLRISLFKWLITLLFICSQTFLPFVLQSEFSLSAAQYSYYLLLPSLAPIVGSVLIKLALPYFKVQMLLLIFTPLILAAALVFIVLPLSLFSTLFGMALFMLALGGIYPCVLQMVTKPFPQQTGAVNAFVGAVDMLIFSVLASQVNRFFVHDIQSLGYVYLVVACVLLLSGFSLLKSFISAVRLQNTV